jgi:hypothetical protein
MADDEYRVWPDPRSIDRVSIPHGMINPQRREQDDCDNDGTQATDGTDREPKDEEQSYER